MQTGVNHPPPNLNEQWMASPVNDPDKSSGPQPLRAAAESC
jgi:hypothetical protein